MQGRIRPAECEWKVHHRIRIHWSTHKLLEDVLPAGRSKTPAPIAALSSYRLVKQGSPYQ